MSGSWGPALAPSARPLPQGRARPEPDPMRGGGAGRPGSACRAGPSWASARAAPGGRGVRGLCPPRGLALLGLGARDGAAPRLALTHVGRGLWFSSRIHEGARGRRGHQRGGRSVGLRSHWIATFLSFPPSLSWVALGAAAGVGSAWPDRPHVAWAGAAGPVAAPGRGNRAWRTATAPAASLPRPGPRKL